jgi:hypothetical protein
MTVTVTGGTAIADRFLDLPKAMERKIARAALREGGGPMLAAIQARIPRKTGLLARSTRLRYGKHDRPGRFAILISAWATAGAFAKARAKSGRAAEASAVLARHAKSDAYSVFYGLFVERGHGGPYPAKAHPFAGPGFDATVDSAADAIEEKLFEGIDEAL